jgi:hypothetical protein
MRLGRLAPLPAAVCLFAQPPKPGRDANQPIDEEYTKKIREYTREPFFNSPRTEHLPASKTIAGVWMRVGT